MDSEIVFQNELIKGKKPPDEGVSGGFRFLYEKFSYEGGK